MAEGWKILGFGLLLLALILGAVALAGPRGEWGRLACAECAAEGQPAYVWAQPAPGSAAACALEWGAVVRVSERRGEWVRVQLGGCRGWVSGRLVRPA